MTNKIKSILVTGGAGYIGSHTCVQLLGSGYRVIILDNFCNSKRCVMQRLEQISGCRPDFVVGDVRDRSLLRAVFKNHRIESVIHFAGLKAVGDAEMDPLTYYDNNVNGSLALLEEMAYAGVSSIVFSSSATVYGDPGVVKYSEATPLKPVNVYGRTKMMVENILRDLKRADPAWRIAILRYFNPVGAHESGMIGEDPSSTPNNLMPYIAQVAVGKRDKLMIFGNNYPTPDGTGLRDYIHIDDLAKGHIAALNYLTESEETLTVNLGTGKPSSVLDMIKAFEQACGKPIPYEFVGRRAGDLAEYYADPSLAKKMLNWSVIHGIEQMCADTWRWQKMNPNGY